MVRQVIRVPYSDDRPRLSKATPSMGGTLPCPLPRSAMHRVPSLLFDMDLDQEHSHLARVATLDETDLDPTRASVLAALEPANDAEYMVLLHVRFAREDALRRGRTLTLASLAEVLHRLGYGVRIRTANGGGRCGACLRNLRHSFLAVSLAGPGTPCNLVVDPAFREQFEIAHMPERYARVMAMVPEEVVLPPARLEKLVEVLCGEMQRAFGEMDLSLPPWRALNAMLSKWHPGQGKSKDVAVQPRSRSGSGSAAAHALRRGLSLQPTVDEVEAGDVADAAAPGSQAPEPPVCADGCPECGSRACATHAAPPSLLGRRGDEDGDEDDHLLDSLVGGTEADAEAMLGSSPGAIATPSSASDSDGEGPLVDARAPRPTPSLHVSWGLGLGSSCSGSALGNSSQPSRSALQAR